MHAKTQRIIRTEKMRELHEVHYIVVFIFFFHIYGCRSAHKKEASVEELRQDHRFLPILQNSAMISDAGSIGVSADKLKKWREKYEHVYHKVCDEYASLDSQYNPRLPQVHFYSLYFDLIGCFRMYVLPDS